MNAMNEELLTASEAAQLLKISPRRLQQMVRRGILRPDPSSPSTVKNRRFRMRDLAALQEIRAKGNNPEAAFVIAKESAIEARALRREVDRMKFVLGLDIPALPIDRDNVISTLLKAEDALREPPTQDHKTLLDWARIFHGVSEVHFEAIAFHTGQKEPWRAFLALARKLCAEENVALTRSDPDLYGIYRGLNAALQRLRRAAYFYIREQYGKVCAAKLLPEVKGCPHEDVIAMSFNNMVWEAPPLPAVPRQ